MTWKCGKCDGAKVPLHSIRCPKRVFRDQQDEMRRELSAEDERDPVFEAGDPADDHD